MQNDAFKRFSKDLTDALVIPVNYLNKKAKRIPLPGNDKKNRVEALSLAGLQAGVLKNHDDHHQPSPGGLQYDKAHRKGSESVSLHNFSLSTISKTSVDDNQSFTSNGSDSTASIGKFGKSGPKSPLSPIAFRGSGGLPVREEPPLVHCPPSVASLEQFSPERLAWVKECIYQPTYPQPQNSNVLKSSGNVWDTVEGASHGGGHFHNGHSGARSTDEITLTHNYPGHCFGRSGYNNPNEATGLLFVKLMQVTNKATTKLFDVEWSLRVGSIERTSHPTRSFKDNPGNTATMNEVFLFDVNEPFQLDMEVTGTPVATKFGTMAGFTNNQIVQLGSLQLAFSLESMEKSVRTYKLRRPLHGNHHGGKPSVKTDCEIIVMVGLHVLEEPVEDRSWETDTVYQGNLTVMTRGSRMAGWKRYWAVLEGASLKLYDPDYQQKRDALAAIPLAHILSIQQHDYDKVDVGSNGFCLIVDRQGVDMTHSADFDMTGMDYNIYAFTDSSYLKEVWNANLEEAMDTYRENMDRRYQVRQAKRNRRVSSLSSSSAASVGGGRGQSSPEDDDEDVVDLIDLKFVS
ncbi:hypothetical protein BGZ93_004265 [Podila epicladia]|nr:hypothetical protein BGZ92_009133 [Podila epicladia]KAG0100109.1 hypothetical protein BGZ93_004265 [Podila epicladia]